MYQITEIIGNKKPGNHKVIYGDKDNCVTRTNHSFDDLRSLAEFCRSHDIFTTYQKEVQGYPRNSQACEDHYVGNNLLWLDLDFNVDLEDLRDRLKKHNLKGFAYYTSKYYSDKIPHARLCVVCDRVIDKDNWPQVKFYANQVLRKLEYKIEEKEDAKIYNYSSYIVESRGKYKKEDLIINEKGNTFTWLKQKDVEKSLVSQPKKNKIIDQGCFGIAGEYAMFLNTLSSVQYALARHSDFEEGTTISISFTTIPEKTPLGYYIKLDNPWFVNHPNPNKKRKYLSNILSKEDFIKFKQFYFTKGLITKDPFKPDPRINLDLLKFDKVVQRGYLKTDIFPDQYLTFIESPTGSGKTTAISNWIKQQKGKSVLFISVNRMQAVATYKSLNRDNSDIICYLKATSEEYDDAKNAKRRKNSRGVPVHNVSFQEKARQGIIPDKLICGVLSLHHLINKDGTLKKVFDYVIIDEVSTITASVSSPVKLLIERLDTFEQCLKSFKKLLVSADKVICMDGFISKPIVNLIENLSEKEAWLIQNNIPTYKAIEIFMCAGNQPKFEGENTCKKYLENILEDIENASYKNRRLMLVALSSKKLSIKLQEYLTKHFPNKRTVLFNSDITETDGDKVIAIFEDLDAYMKKEKIDIMIYSPTVTTGVDIPQAKGTNVYQIISGDQLSSHTNYQMTMRGREASGYKVLIVKRLNKYKQLFNKKTYVSDPKNYPIFNSLVFDSFNEYMSYVIYKLQNSTNFKGINSLKSKEEHFDTSGFLLAYSILEQFISKAKWESIKDYSDLKKALVSTNSSLEGLKIALKIDKALILFEKELWEYGKSPAEQYLNFLRHEQCRISREEDIEVSESIEEEIETDKEKYVKEAIEKYSSELKRLDCWKNEYSELKDNSLYKIVKKSRVFNSIKKEIVNTFGKGIIRNNKVLEIYEFLHRKSYTIGKEGYRRYLKGKSTKEKIASVKSVLSLLFNTISIKNGDFMEIKIL
jgi:hypothetical protein